MNWAKALAAFLVLGGAVFLLWSAVAAGMWLEERIGFPRALGVVAIGLCAIFSLLVGAGAFK